MQGLRAGLQGQHAGAARGAAGAACRGVAGAAGLRAEAVGLQRRRAGAAPTRNVDGKMSEAGDDGGRRWRREKISRALKVQGFRATC